jgi:hypothetical protein
VKTYGVTALLTLALTAMGLPVPAAPADEPRVSYDTCVVGLNVTYQKWDEDRPWVKTKPETRRVSAVLIDTHRVLTTADALDYAVFLQIATFGRARQSPPRIERIDRSVNLALLSIDDDIVATGLRPVQVADKTPRSGTLRTARWRGQQLEVAASRVIRIEVERSLVSYVYHGILHMRTDIAGGGWAEPVFNGDKLVALTVSQSDDESRAIPAEILSLFLKQASSDAPPAGFATLGANWQLNRDSSVSRFLGQTGDPKGVLIREVPWGSTGCGQLKPRDILLSLGGEAIDAEGYYQHPWLGRVGFNEILAEGFHPGDKVPARVLRDGREQDLTLTARTYPAALNLVPYSRGNAPPYVVAGGLIIRELDEPYLWTWGKEWDKDAPRGLMSRFWLDTEAQTPERRRFVLISKVLPSAYNAGYQDLHDVVIDRVNGRAIGRIEDVIDAFKTPKSGFHVIELSPDSPRDEIVLAADTFESATAEILSAYAIPAAQRLREDTLPEGGGECRGDY